MSSLFIPIRYVRIDSTAVYMLGVCLSCDHFNMHVVCYVVHNIIFIYLFISKPPHIEEIDIHDKAI